MKKLMMMALFAGVVAFVATGCTTITTSDGAERMDLPESVSTDYRANFEHKNVRVKGSGNVNVLFGIFAWGSEGFAENSDLSYFSFFPSPANYAKSSAVYNACQTNGADTLLGTRYKVTTTDYFVFKQVKCEVEGFPAVMTSIEKMVPYVLPEGAKLIYLEPGVKPTMIK